MTAPSQIGDLSPAVNLIVQPLVLESLQAIDEGKALEDALPADTDAVALNAAVRRLVAVGAVLASPAGPFGRHTLTERGTQLLKLLDELDAHMPEPTRRDSTSAA
ncbi:hypothetical protein [Phytohabitans aurantiacus]|uniref:Transcriptional regulator n=1 Tax=Phytohabitans aurantiacus TaxID=3016789 RepID=A0ABQ5R2Y0_9ACTN|nr:hypothetical protein [Phytohabitans aurantiacus]GLI00896.1 hypothetical protein Pa4123_61720 [Phytohabitans aurantiacus]